MDGTIVVAVIIALVGILFLAFRRGGEDKTAAAAKPVPPARQPSAAVEPDEEPPDEPEEKEEDSEALARFKAAGSLEEAAREALPLIREGEEGEVLSALAARGPGALAALVAAADHEDDVGDVDSFLDDLADELGDGGPAAWMDALQEQVDEQRQLGVGLLVSAGEYDPERLLIEVFTRARHEDAIACAGIVKEAFSNAEKPGPALDVAMAVPAGREELVVELLAEALEEKDAGEAALRHGSPVVRRAAVEARGASDSGVLGLAGDADECVREAVAKSGVCTPELGAALARDASPRVRAAVAWMRADVHRELGMQLLRDANACVAMVAADGLGEPSAQERAEQVVTSAVRWEKDHALRVIARHAPRERAWQAFEALGLEDDLEGQVSFLDWLEADDLDVSNLRELARTNPAPALLRAAANALDLSDSARVVSAGESLLGPANPPRVRRAGLSVLASDCRDKPSEAMEQFLSSGDALIGEMLYALGRCVFGEGDKAVLRRLAKGRDERVAEWAEGQL